MIEYGFFDSVDGDRKYNSKNFSDYFEGLISDGVYYTVGEKLKVSAASGMKVNVLSGRAKLLNRYVKNTTSLSIDIASASVEYPRYDAVIVKVDVDERTGTIEVVQGTPAQTPQKPVFSAETNTAILVLAYVYVPTAATQITSANIEDQRGTSVCPWVTGLVASVDTSALVAEYRSAIDQAKTEIRAEIAEIESFYAQMKDELSIETRLIRNDYRLNLTDGQNTLNFDFTNFDMEKDVLLVHLNGTYLASFEDYTYTNETITITRRFSTGDTLDITIIKCY